MTAAPAVRHTVDELAELVGVPTRTIRYYQSEGVLPPPSRVGRVAYYDADHVQRLRLVVSLRDRGLRLDAISHVIDQIESGGDSLQRWLGITELNIAPWLDERPLLLSPDELRVRSAGDDLLVHELTQAGLVRREDGAPEPYYVVTMPTLLDATVALAAVGVSPVVSVQSAEMIRDRMATMADQLVEQYARYLTDDARRVADPARQQRLLQTLRTVAFTVVRAMFAKEIERRLRQLIEQGPVAFQVATDAVGQGAASR